MGSFVLFNTSFILTITSTEWMQFDVLLSYYDVYNSKNKMLQMLDYFNFLFLIVLLEKSRIIAFIFKYVI